jgi:hypothetical protein
VGMALVVIALDLMRRACWAEARMGCRWFWGEMLRALH